MRNDAAVVPVPAVDVPVPDQVPFRVVWPADGDPAVRKFDGRLIEHSMPDGSAAAQLAGSGPEKIFRVPPVPTVATIWAA